MRLIILFILMLDPWNIARAQTTPDVCRVSMSVWHVREKLGTGLYVFGEFRPTAFDETTDKSFKDTDSYLTISAHVEYGDFSAAEKHKPIYIQLTLDVFNEEQKTFATADDSVTAKATYRKRWGQLTVEKRVTIGDQIYTFGLTCDDGTKTRKGHF